MRNITKIVKSFSLALSALLILGGCMNIFDPPKLGNPHANNTGADEVGYFSVSIAEFARTIRPDSLSVSDFNSYRLAFSGGPGGTVSADRTSASVSDPVELRVGTWTLTVSAYTSADCSGTAIAQGILPGINVGPGQLNTCSVELGPITSGGTGDFFYRISFPVETPAITAAMVVTNLSTLATMNITPPNAALSSGWGLWGPSSGTYSVVVSLTKSDGRLAVHREILHVYQGRASYFEFTFDENYFVQTFVTNGNNDGSGSLRRAVERAPANSTVIVEPSFAAGGTITLTELLTIDKNITLEGNSVTITQSGVIGSMLNITAPTGAFYIRRVNFTGGNNVNSPAGNGGAITHSGASVLYVQSCIFYDNHVNGYGGAIYHTAGTLYVFGCTFVNNSAGNSGGGAIYRAATIVYGANLYEGNSTLNSLNMTFRDGGGVYAARGYNVWDISSAASGELGVTNAGNKFDAPTPLVDTPYPNPFPPADNSFYLADFSEAIGNVTVNPDTPNYYLTDFYGNAITFPAAAGAVQAQTTGNRSLTVQANQNSRGYVTVDSATESYDTPLTKTKGNTVTLQATANSDYTFYEWEVVAGKVGTNGVGSFIATNPLTFTLGGDTIVKAHFKGDVYVTNTNNIGSGSLREALATAFSDDTIHIIGSGTPAAPQANMVIQLDTPLEIATAKTIVIEGNGVTIKPSSLFPATPSATSSLLRITADDVDLTIRCVHFTGGRAIFGGAIMLGVDAVTLFDSTVTVESCIFSGNTATGNLLLSAGGALFNYGQTMTVTGCTFYGNSADAIAGAIYSARPLILTGNIFHGNTAPSAPVAASNEPITASYNVVDADFAISDPMSETGSCGWLQGTGDFYSIDQLINATTFAVNSTQAKVLTTLPAGYPTVDFNGDTITAPAAAGAVQAHARYTFTVTVNNASRGSISANTAVVSGGTVDATLPITVTAAPTSSYEFHGWELNGVHHGTDNPVTLPNLTANTTLTAIFGGDLVVDDPSDWAGNDSDGDRTLRWALDNAEDGDLIRIDASLIPGTITLGSSLISPAIELEIEGNGVTIEGTGFPLLVIPTGADVLISRIWFKGADQGAIQNSGELDLHSCIFTGNTASNGGAIYNSGEMVVLGSTFYHNTATGSGGAIYNFNTTGTLTLAGNVFYGNTATGSGPVVSNDAGAVTTSHGYNISDSASGASGWTFVMGDIHSTTQPIGLDTLRPINNGPAASHIPDPTAIEDYPEDDFNGDPITAPAAAGALQTSASGYLLTLTNPSGTQGTVTVTTGSTNPDGLYTGTIQITAAANAGYELTGWTVTHTSSGAALLPAPAATSPLSLPMDDNYTVTAVWGSTGYTLTVVNDSAKGTVTPSTGSQTGTIPIEATPGPGWIFDKWIVTETVGGTLFEESEDNPYSLDMDVAAYTIEAVWEDIIPLGFAATDEIDDVYNVTDMMEFYNLLRTTPTPLPGTINNGGDNKNYIINIKNDISGFYGDTNGIIESTTGIKVAIRSKGHTTTPWTLTLGTFSGHLLNVQSGTVMLKDITLSGLGMTNNRTLVNVGSLSAGTLEMRGDVTITGNNNTGNHGGGVSISYGTINMYNGKITNNTADLGGGVYMSGGTFNMYDGEISGNNATGNGYSDAGAGGVDVGSGTFRMYGGKITGNTTTLYGGGVCVSNFGTFEMDGGEISDNTAVEKGGGVYVGGGYYGYIRIANGIIYGSDAAAGLANTATDNGDALYNGYTGTPPSGTTNVELGTFSPWNKLGDLLIPGQAIDTTIEVIDGVRQ